MTLMLTNLASPLGSLTLARSEECLVAVGFDDGWLAAHLARRFPHATPERDTAPSPAARALEAYFSGELTALDGLPVDGGGTRFQRAVWAELRRIPPGETLGYGALAARLGKPGAARAVGRANGLNPIPIVVPCHRVIGASGTLTGYAGGLARKKWLLDHERGQRAMPPLYAGAHTGNRPIA